MMHEKDPNLLYEVFNQRAGILTFFGMLGGSVRAAVLKTGWKEGVRVVFVGGAVAFGVGICGPILLSPWIGKLPSTEAGAMGTLTASSFIIGLVAVTLVERFIDRGKKKDTPSTPSVYTNQVEEKPNANQG